MLKILSGGMIAAVLATSLFAQSQTTQQAAPVQTSRAAQNPQHGIPGAVKGTERWIVHFKKRSFDLSEFRAAVYARKSAAEVEKIVKGLEAEVIADQQAFVTKVKTELGAHVVAQWWLINACAIDVPFKNLAKVRALENVDFLEPDQAWQPWILTATGSQNHNSDFVQNVLKIDGTGVSVGIMDTGQDENMGGSGRPHRTYYVKGDPTNTSGTGIRNSRLVLNKRFGAQPADDVHGHGTGVASIAAGGRWNNAAADHGHAFGANIAGYSIANNTGGTSSSTVMTNAWQAMTADRVRHNIVSANLSYSGSNSLLNSAQKAIDSASFNGDIVCCTAAGNSSSSTRSSQSNLNGLAVGAIVANSHVMASFSSRGPLSNGRFFPDITGCGVSTVMARRNSESSNYVGSGTSMASPQVCGVAALVRTANKNLTALETKAILLATPQDISQANSSRDRNAYGLGMARADKAVQLALSKSGVGTMTIDSQNRSRRITLNVQKDRAYAVVVTWHRSNMNSASYSNLDFRVLDGTTVISSSNTPLNAYENTVFLARKTGAFTLEVTSPSLVGSSQKFAYAFTEVPKPPIPGRVSSFGAGCKGTGNQPARCQSINENASFRNSTSFAGVTYAVEIVANANLSVEGYEMINRSSTSSPVNMTTRLYDANSAGRPNNVLATGSVTVGTSATWYRTIFNRKVQIQRGQKFFIAFVNASPTGTRLGTMNSGSVVPYWRNNGSGGSWIRFTSRAWNYRVICTSSGGGAVPSLGSVGVPEIGNRFTLQVRQAAPSANVLLLVGTSNSSWSGIRLPWALPGAPGCNVLAAGHVMIPARANAQGSLDLAFTTPLDKTLIGNTYYAQAAIEDQKANSFGYAMTNALAIVIGGTP